MSSASLKLFLEKLDKQLGRDNKSKDYRNLTANKKSHVLYLNKKEITKALRELFKMSSNLDEESKKKAVNYLKGKKFEKHFTRFITETRDNLNRLSHTSKNSRTFTVRKPKTDNFSYLNVIIVADEGSREDIFNILKAQYKTPLDTLYEEMLLDIKQTVILRPSVVEGNKDIDSSTAGKTLNLGHILDVSNIKLFLESAVHDAIEGLPNLSGKDLSLLQSKGKKGLDLPDVVWEIEKNVKTDLVKVSLSSAFQNNIDSTKEGTYRTNMANRVTAAISKLERDGHLAYLKGSDSLYDKKRKETIDKTIDAFKKSKNKKVKVTKEDTTVDNTKSFAKKVIKPKNKVQRGKTGKVPRKTMKLSPDNSPAASPLALITQFNARLPQAVEAAMGSPRLNYRSGRFASGVRVVDAVTTPKGFTSYGYTYQLYPYQTFEPGYAQGSVDRDPRRLIDRAMRDIAADFAIARFYTRRV